GSEASQLGTLAGDTLEVDNPPKCCTFGENPVVRVANGADASLKVGVVVGKKIDVEIFYSIKLTPVSASFFREGLCYQGVCSDEKITGGVVVAIKAQFHLKAYGNLTIAGVKLSKAGLT